MIEDLTNHIDSSKEVLSSLPKNNKKNKTKYLREISKLKEETENNFNNLKQELLKRSKELDNLNESQEIDKIQKKILELDQNVDIVNKYNSAYEKLGIDISLYNITNYQDDNLESINNEIKKMIEVFKEAGIILKATDFRYSPYAFKYMDILFSLYDNINGVKVKESFEKIYWKCPNLISHIVLNFKYLYFKNINKFNKYSELQKNNLLKIDSKNDNKFKLFNKVKLMDENEINSKYKKCKLQLDLYTINDKYLIVDKFRKKEYKKNTFEKEKIDKLYQTFTDNKDRITESNVLKLHYSVKEYKKYLEYKYLIDEVMILYKDKDKYKNITKLKLKDIAKNESILKKLNDSYKRAKDKNKEDKLYLDITNKIDELNKLYNEYDIDSFNEKILLTLSDDSTIEKLLSLVCAYRINLYSFIKKHDQSLDDNALSNIYQDLKDYLLSPYNTIINNLTISKEYDIPLIISDKYNLMNININKDSLDESNLDNLIENTNQIILYNIFSKMDITIEQIDYNCQILEIVKEFNEEN